MTRYSALILLLTVSLSLLANSKTEVKVISESLKLTSHFSPASGYELKLDGKTLYKFGDSTGGGPKFLYENHQGRDYPFLGVLDVYQGDGCPSISVLISVDSRGVGSYSKRFGNCNEPEIEGGPDRLVLKYAASPETRRLAETWAFEGGRLRRQ